jgi:2-polyprenyl-6-methoxyphenol hydroxylase-like FAD-dependent oxidoreductase
MSDRAVVVGAGIAGLATAIALKGIGLEVVVLERAPQLCGVGAGIALWPNAVHALRRLGIGDAVESAGAPAHDAAFRSWRGSQLGPSITAKLAGHFGAPLVIVHRVRLQAVMRQALGADTVRLGAECATVTHDDGEATVRMVSGGSERGALVVGADGLRSGVRAALFEGRPPRYAGITAWRGVVPLDDGLGRRTSSGESFGRGAVFGISRLNGTQAYWWASARRVESDSDESEREKAALLRAFSGWHAPIPELVAATPADAIIRTCLYERPPLERVSSGRVALAGDAAHPMLPNLGQGACQALEDAVVLADQLVAAPDIVAALARYSAQRMPHTAAVVSASSRMSRRAHLRGPLTSGLRNGLMRATPASLTLRRLEPILADAVPRPA